MCGTFAQIQLPNESAKYLITEMDEQEFRQICRNLLSFRVLTFRLTRRSARNGHSQPVCACSSLPNDPKATKRNSDWISLTRSFVQVQRVDWKRIYCLHLHAAPLAAPAGCRASFPTGFRLSARLASSPAVLPNSSSRRFQTPEPRPDGRRRRSDRYDPVRACRSSPSLLEPGHSRAASTRTSGGWQSTPGKICCSFGFRRRGALAMGRQRCASGQAN